MRENIRQHILMIGDLLLGLCTYLKRDVAKEDSKKIVLRDSFSYPYFNPDWGGA